MSRWMTGWALTAIVLSAAMMGCAANERPASRAASIELTLPKVVDPDFEVEAAEAESAHEPNIPDRDAGFPRDREAILSMAGGYRVDYRFEETAALRPGYELASPYTASATEWVAVAQDTGERVVLQHLLVMGEPARVVKHWQQTWDYAPSAVVRYVDENVWQNQALLSPGRTGRWSRTVSEADGSPSYAAWGRWSHGEAAGSRWSASTAVLAPPPRREGLRRSAYQAVLVRDRIQLLGDGWLQQQALTKRWINDATPGLARESGVVRYGRVEAGDAATQTMAVAFGEATRYWVRAGPFWAEARRAWDDWMAGGGAVRLRDEVDGQPRWRRVFALASMVSENQQSPVGEGTTGERIRDQIDAVLRDYVVRP